MAIPVFLINLKRRTDRRGHILQQFFQKAEFAFHIVEACDHNNGAIGLWNTITQILTTMMNDESDFAIICEDDHQFTKHYSKELLFHCIAEAQERDADILSGGVSWFQTAIRSSGNIFWIENFSGLQFTVIFKKFYYKILTAHFHEGEASDYKIAGLSEKKFVIYPFISTQKEFGYSDVTSKNNAKGKVEGLFLNSSESLKLLGAVSASYIKNDPADCHFADMNYESTKISTYILSEKGKDNSLQHITKQFLDKNEFDCSVIYTSEKSSEASGVWECIRKIISMAVKNEDDAIVICKDDHEFTPVYSKTYFFKNLIRAAQQGADYLSGGAINFKHTSFVSKNLYWVDAFLLSTFSIIYKSFFQAILSEPFDESANVDLLSEITTNKMIMYPFISYQKDTKKDIYINTEKRLGRIENAFLKYSVGIR